MLLKPWQRALSAHLEAQPYLFGARPSLADFALFGGNAAHRVLLARYRELRSAALDAFLERAGCLRWSPTTPIGRARSPT